MKLGSRRYLDLQAEREAAATVWREEATSDGIAIQDYADRVNGDGPYGCPHCGRPLAVHWRGQACLAARRDHEPYERVAMLD